MAGEAGIGKTSLLDYLVLRATGLQVLRAHGVESERDLPFAGLAGLLKPVLGHVDVLPDPQRAALRSALALGPPAPGDSFAICAATLSLLSFAAAKQPVLAVVDDAHWLDEESARAVKFTAWRLGHDAIGLVLAVRRTPSGGFDAGSGAFDALRMDTMVIAGLDQAAAMRLLARSGRVIAPLVCELLAAGTGGNPLALLQLADTLTEAQLDGTTSLPEPLPVGPSLRRAFAQRLHSMKPATRHLLLLAAAGTVDLATLQRASKLLSLDLADLPAAEDAGVLRVHDGQVEFTHPLLRSASYYAAGSGERRAAHSALAAVTDQETQPIRRAWHLAAAVVGPDETAAAEDVLALDRVRAAIVLASASDVCRVIGRLGLAARAAALADGTGGIGWLLSQVSLAQVTILTGGREAGRRIISGVLGHPDAKSSDPVTDLVRMRCGQALVWCEEYPQAEEVLRFTVDSIRALGRYADLRYGLASLSDLHFRTGDWSQAFSEAIEAVELTTDRGTRNELGWALVCVARVEAAMGAEGASREHLLRAARLADSGSMASLQAMAAATSGFLELGLANYGRSAADLAQAAALVSRQGIREPCAIPWRPDFIESLAGLGRLAEGREQLETLEAEAAATGSRWAAAVAARCRGLLEDTPRRAVARLTDAVAIAEASASGFEQARARLCLGHALRRTRQSGAAKRQLQQAHATFELLGATPWAARAAEGLASVGAVTARRREPIHVRLTPQELRVALHVAEGLSNQEVASRLLVSHKTIEVHLSHIYDKLGVRSRTGLARLVYNGEIQ